METSVQHFNLSYILKLEWKEKFQAKPIAMYQTF